MNIASWAIGILATISLAFNGYNQNTNAGQSADIYDLNREVGELGTDLKYVRSSVDELKQLQIRQLNAQGISYKLASSSNQTLQP